MSEKLTAPTTSGTAKAKKTIKRKASESDDNDVEEFDVKKNRKSRADLIIKSNSESRIILFAITSIEWEAVYLKPAEFASLQDPISLTRAVQAQCRDFGERIKPSTKKKIYDSLIPKCPPPQDDDHDLLKTRHIIGTVLEGRKKAYNEAQNILNDESIHVKERQRLYRQELKKIFQYPEQIEEISKLFTKLKFSEQPRKFRPHGFQKKYDKKSFERLNTYDDFLFFEKKRKSNFQQMLQINENSRYSTRTKTVEKGAIIHKNIKANDLDGDTSKTPIGFQENPIINLDINEFENARFTYDSTSGQPISTTTEINEVYTYSVVNVDETAIINNIKLQLQSTFNDLNCLENLVGQNHISTANLKKQLIEATKIDLNQSNTEVNKLKEELQKLRTESEHSKKENESLKKELQELKQTVTDLESQLKAEKETNLKFVEKNKEEAVINANKKAFVEAKNDTVKKQLQEEVDINFSAAIEHFENGEYIIALQKFLLAKATASVHKGELEKKTKETADKIDAIIKMVQSNADDRSVIKRNLKLFGIEKFNVKHMDQIVLKIRRCLHARKEKWLTDILGNINCIRDKCLSK